jgi:hypothetical protein
MSAPAGNSNAKKWTEEVVVQCLERMKEDVKFNPDTFHISIALANQGLYCEIWTYWKRVFHEDEAINEKIGVIDHMIETKLQVGALKGELDPVVVKFALANSFQWKPFAEENLCPECPPINLRNMDEAYLIGEAGNRIYLRDHKLMGRGKGGFEYTVKFPEPGKKKWTDEEVKEYLALMANAVIVPDLWTHEMALLHLGLPKSAWEIWRDNYPTDIQQMMKGIETLYYAKLLKAMTRKQVNRPIAVYIMKRLYKWEPEPKPQIGDPNEIKGTFINSPHGLFLIGGY